MRARPPLLLLALRNLRRHLRRTLISGAAVAFGLAVLVVGAAMGDGAHEQMIDAGVRSLAGHVVVQAPGWQGSRDVSLAVADEAGVRRRLEAALPGAAVVPRVFFQGLLSAASGASGVGVSAVDPELEVRVSDAPRRLVEGAWLSDEAGILVGATLARTLDVRVGSRVVLMTQRGTDIESQLFRVRGVFRYGIDEIDGFSAQIHLRAAQRLLGLEGAATQVAVHLPSERGTGRALRLAREALAGRAVEVLPWRQALPDLHQWIVLDEATLYVFIGVLFLIVLLGIANTVLMSVLERVREFGVLLALGLEPAQLRSLVLLEGAVLGAVSVGAGLVVGLLLAWPVCTVGVDYGALVGGGAMEAAGVALDTRIVGRLVPWKLALFALASLLVTVAAAWWPARRAAALRPVECLQHR